MDHVRPERHRGVALVAGSAVAWSTAGLFTRLLPFDSWTILFWRGLFGCAFTTLYLIASRPGAWRELGRIGRPGWVVACLSTVGMVAFIPALQLTTVANVAIINATGPFVAATLAWLWLGETAPPRTLLASLASLCGVAIIVSGTRASMDLVGIGLACAMRLALSSMTVTIRRHKDTPMVAAAALSNILGTIVSVPFAGALLDLSAADIGLFALFGLFQITLGLTLFVIGSRLLPPTQASLISALQAPLSPLWVWLAFHEVPAPRTLIGGAVVLAAVAADILAEARAQRRSAAARFGKQLAREGCAAATE
jgi:drug/metabolite transporter (DMT)-like permease